MKKYYRIAALKLSTLWYRYFLIFYTRQRISPIWENFYHDSTSARMRWNLTNWDFNRLMLSLLFHCTVCYILETLALSFLKLALWKLSWIQLLKCFSTYLQVLQWFPSMELLKQKTMDLMILCSLPAFADWEIREFYKDSLYCQLQIRFPWNKRKCFPNQELIISLDNQILKNGSGIDIFSPISTLHMIKLNLKLQGREKKI